MYKKFLNSYVYHQCKFIQQKRFVCPWCLVHRWKRGTKDLQYEHLLKCSDKFIAENQKYIFSKYNLDNQDQSSLENEIEKKDKIIEEKTRFINFQSALLDSKDKIIKVQETFLKSKDKIIRDNNFSLYRINNLIVNVMSQMINEMIFQENAADDHTAFQENTVATMDGITDAVFQENAVAIMNTINDQENAVATVAVFQENAVATDAVNTVAIVEDINVQVIVEDINVQAIIEDMAVSEDGFDERGDNISVETMDTVLPELDPDLDIPESEFGENCSIKTIHLFIRLLKIMKTKQTNTVKIKLYK